MSLCSDCQDFTFARLRKGDIRLKEDLRSLAASADEGCPICVVLWRQFRHGRWERVERWLLGEFTEMGRRHRQDVGIWLTSTDYLGQTLEPQQRELDDFSGSDWRCHITVCLGTNEPIASTYLSLYADAGTLAAKYIRGRCFVDSSNHDKSIAWARRRLRFCQNRHARCGASVDREMPTRVVDLGPPGSNIFVTKGQLGKYMALSYSWGNAVKHKIRLQNSSYTAMLHSIDEASMTKTHQEAFRLARDLGFRYIWIDALCIIQDDDKDWETESSRMADIFDSAEITLVAARSRESTLGFLEHRPISTIESYRMEYDPPEAPSGTRSECYISLPRSRKYGPLLERAWCFQERILSRRSLVYAADQISLQCQERMYWEDGEGSAESTNIDRRIFLVKLDDRITDKKEVKLRGLLSWYHMLSEYSGRDMFDTHDVFAALMGLAKAVQKTVGGRYLAGLWEDDMIQGLLWVGQYSVWRRKVGKTCRPLKRPVERNTKKPHLLGRQAIRAPSWSWASVEGPIWYHTNGQPKEYWMKYRISENYRLRPVLQTHWTAQVHCGVDQAWMPACELEVYGVPKIVCCSESLVSSYWSPGTRIEKRNLRFEKNTKWPLFPAINIQQSGTLLAAPDDVGPEHIVGVGIFDVPEEKTKSVWCLRVINSEGLMLRLDEKGKFHRLGKFVVEHEAWFEGEEEQKISLV